jgi:hypothetical protein
MHCALAGLSTPSMSSSLRTAARLWLGDSFLMGGVPAIVVERRKELTYLLCQAAELERRRLAVAESAELQSSSLHLICPSHVLGVAPNGRSGLIFFGVSSSFQTQKGTA